MSECPVCGETVPSDRDWCSAGHYAAWDRTAPVDREPRVSREALVTAPRLLVAFAGEAPDRVVLEPGATGVVRVLVRNQSDTVQRIRLRLPGLPAAGWAVTPPHVGLNPWGTRPPFESELAVHFLANALAPGTHPVRILALAGERELAARRCSSRSSPSSTCGPK